MAEPAIGRSPTRGLLLGLVITLAAVVAYSAYISHQIAGLRELQTNLIDRNRRDSLQLLRIQNDLNSVALAMRDMLANDEPYPLTAWSAQFQRLRGDLDQALKTEEQLSAAHRTADQQTYLQNSFRQFWDALDRTFALAAQGQDKQARELIRLSLQARQESLSTAVARFLVENNETEQAGTQQAAAIYDRVQRQLYVFFFATLLAIVLTSLYVIRANRRIFAHVNDLSEQRSELAQKLISMQESTLRSISREMHDEFGQILTAIGSMLTRAGRRAGDETLRADIREVGEIAQTALDKVRSLSQALHPVTLEEAGLESTLEWYLPTLERQSGIRILYEKTGDSAALESEMRIHVYRVLQEALNNVIRHSGAQQAWVRLRFLDRELKLEVEDDGKGFIPNGSRRGLGVTAMRERAELLGGRLEFLPSPTGGTLVRLAVPLERVLVHAT